MSSQKVPHKEKYFNCSGQASEVWALSFILADKVAFDLN